MRYLMGTFKAGHCRPQIPDPIGFRLAVPNTFWSEIHKVLERRGWAKEDTSFAEPHLRMFEKEGVLTKLVGAFQCHECRYSTDSSTPAQEIQLRDVIFKLPIPICNFLKCFQSISILILFRIVEVWQATLSSQADLCFWQNGRATGAHQRQPFGEGTPPVSQENELKKVEKNESKILPSSK